MKTSSRRLSVTLEAYGVRGLKSLPWRKTFASRAALTRWAETHDAEVLGTRELCSRCGDNGCDLSPLSPTERR